MINTKSKPHSLNSGQAGSRSRIGKKSVQIPEGVSVEVAESAVTVRGPKGELSIKLPNNVFVQTKDGVAQVSAQGGKSREHKQSLSFAGAQLGRTRAELANLISGVTEGWAKTLEIIGTGYRASTDGKMLTLNLGFSHQVIINAPEGINFAVAQNKITITGTDKQVVGQVAANIRQFRSPEPYKGKGIKYEGEFIRKKAGKAAKSAGGAA
ncbi:50S ribosomal protein L6 [Candidatus Microgenomates bacterium]|nr:50S ribosomal protein L6 [Candidatus Microgenomates bacterium]